MRLATNVCNCLTLEKGIKYIVGYFGFFISALSVCSVIAVLCFYDEFERETINNGKKILMFDLLISLITGILYMIVCPMVVLAIKWVIK